MKNRLKLSILMAVAAGLFWWGCTATKTTASKYVGNWNYIVRNLPDGDIKGIMTISQDGDEYRGNIRSADGSISITVEDLRIENNQLTGHIDYQGMKIDMAGTFDGGEYTGTVSADYNEFPMTAQKVN